MPARRALLLCADALRTDALGAYGNTVVSTPRIDALAAQGTLFRQHCASALSCGPSRASLLTGLYPMTHRVARNTSPFDTRLPSVASLLRSVGVPSYLVGYTDTVAPPYLGPGEGVMPGFEVHTHFNLNAHGLRAWTRRLTERGAGAFADPLDAFRPVEGRLAAYSAADSDTAFVADRTIACLRENRDEPWLIMAAFLRPHAPWVAPQPYHAMYARQVQAGVFAAVASRSSGAATAEHPLVRAQREADSPGWAVPEPGVPAARAVYLGLVTELDHHVGRVLDELDALGIAGDTLVIVTSDHGEMLGDRGLWGSRGCFDAAVHLPLVMHAPGVPQGVVDATTEAVDIAPTILEWMGARPLPYGDGVSLLPALAGRGPSPRAGGFTEFDISDLLGSTALAARGLGPRDSTVNLWRTQRHTYVHVPGLAPLLLDRDAGEEPVSGAADLVERHRMALLDHRLRHVPPTAPGLLGGGM